VGQSHTPSESCWRESFLVSSASGGCLQSLGLLGSQLQAPLCLSAHGVLPGCLCLHAAVFTLVRTQSHWHKGLHYCKTTHLNSLHMQRPYFQIKNWGLGLPHTLWETQFTPYDLQLAGWILIWGTRFTLPISRACYKHEQGSAGLQGSRVQGPQAVGWLAVPQWRR
jgi:hypothetical protein